MRQNVRKTNVVFLSVGVILVVAGVSIVIFWPTVFISILGKQLSLSATSKTYEEWKQPSVELYLDVYLFNWTNSESFVFPNFEKPIMKEHGPYRFREVRDKVKIKFNDNNSTVSYRQFNSYEFIEEESSGSLDDMITNLNMVAIGAAVKSQTYDYHNRKVISTVLNGYYEEDIFVTKSVRELLFEGYEDDMVTMGRTVEIAGFDMKQIPYDKVGWFYLRNATDKMSGRFNVHTGRGDGSKLGLIRRFNDLDHIPQYTGECSRLQGSTGEFFPPGRKRDSIRLFAPDMCRSIPFDYDADVSIHGVRGYRYVAGKRAIDNGTEFPENLCYSPGRAEEAPSGVMNISACKFSSPIYMSYPHFLDADPSYLEGVDGLAPDENRHRSHITLEPLSGIPLEVVIRFQANFLVQHIEDIALYQDHPKVYIPAMWVEQKFLIDESMTEQLKFALKVPTIGQLLGVIIFALGVALVVISCIIRCAKGRNSSANEQGVNLPEVKPSINRRQKETSSPLLDANGKPKVVVKKMNKGAE